MPTNLMRLNMLIPLEEARDRQPNHVSHESGWLAARCARWRVLMRIAIVAIVKTAIEMQRTTLPIDPHIVNALLPDLVGHDRRPSSFVLYLWLYAMTKGAGKKSGFFSYQLLTDRTGLSKRAVQR